MTTIGWIFGCIAMFIEFTCLWIGISAINDYRRISVCFVDQYSDSLMSTHDKLTFRGITPTFRFQTVDCSNDDKRV